MSAGVLAFSIALLASMMLAVPVRALALRVGMVDLPGPRKVHVQPIPLLGGLAMYGGVMLAIIFAFDGAAREQSVGILTGATLVAAAVFGAATGFLRWNFKPAKIFMGDGGAMFLGFLMATLALKLRLSQGSHASALLAPLLILGVTIFDTTLVTISRARRGLLPFAAPGKDHAAHRLTNLGLRQRGAVLSLYLLGAVSGVSSICGGYVPARAALLFAVVVIAAMLFVVAMLEKAPYERQAAKTQAVALTTR